MDRLYNKFFSHLIENKMTYTEHMVRAFSISFKMFVSATKTVIHGIFPYFYTTAATDTVTLLYNDLKTPHN